MSKIRTALLAAIVFGYFILLRIYESIRVTLEASFASNQVEDSQFYFIVHKAMQDDVIISGIAILAMLCVIAVCYKPLKNSLNGGANDQKI